MKILTVASFALMLSSFAVQANSDNTCSTKQNQILNDELVLPDGLHEVSRTCEEGKDAVIITENESTSKTFTFEYDFKLGIQKPSPIN